MATKYAYSPTATPDFVVREVEIHDWKRKWWQSNETEPYTEPRLVICAVEFHQCKNIGDGVGKANNGSKKNRQDAVPFEFFSAIALTFLNE